MLPLIGFDEGMPEKRTILAHLKTKADPTPQFQTVLIDPMVKDPDPQDGWSSWSVFVEYMYDFEGILTTSTGLHVAQVKLIFASYLLTQWGKNAVQIPPEDPSGQVLAYVEWFTAPPKDPHQDMQMYGISCLRSATGVPRGDAVPLTSIVQPCYLLPRFKGRKAIALDQVGADGTVTQITGDNCLELVDDFWINSFQD
ncbi:hypothetical protein M422DRAFT_262909 [Sphaerobolus stellatus SS14]|uniref:Uncharacterized protein n=1 Tax=Sphaerobolus stellatus (strain SS14) TaxID=990650 RepID=A0A0C9VCC4_SPHS4|nr:hypothetical protein M422DRAFT_262909 [Sphaerobolus stellatus SS14]